MPPHVPRIRCVCKVCGNVFLRERHVVTRRGNSFCSKTCAGKARSEAAKITLTCAACGEEFTRKGSTSLATDTPYCSKRCYNTNRNTNKVSCTCTSCGKTFLQEPNRLSPKGNNFCSRDCWRRFKYDKVPRTCKTCGKEFLTKKGEISRDKGIYCSRECYWAKALRTSEERFYEVTLKANEHGCMLWTGTLRRGYGIIQGGRAEDRFILYAHRVAYEIYHDPIPPGMEVRHLCESHYPPGDTTCRACVNPAHLALGSHAENMADMVNAGRNIRGERATFAILTEDEVRSIRNLRRQGWTMQRIADKFGTTVGNVYAIVSRRSWKHVE